MIWSPPPPLGFVKINFDGSKLMCGKSSYGFVIHDDHGMVLAGTNSLGYSTSILQAEAWGLREGVRAALAQGLNNIIIEGDNLAVINALKKHWCIHWEVANISFDVDSELQQFSSFQVFHNFREANRATDFMANRGHRNSSLVYYFPPFDVDFSLIIRKDVLGWLLTEWVCLSFSFLIKKKKEST